MKAEIYTKTVCPFCIRAKRLLTEKSIPYVEWFGSKDSFIDSLDSEDPWIKQKYLNAKKSYKPLNSNKNS